MGGRDERARDCEHQQANEEQPFPAHDVADAAKDGHQANERQNVGNDDPFHLGQGAAKASVMVGSATFTTMIWPKPTANRITQGSVAGV